MSDKNLHSRRPPTTSGAMTIRIKVLSVTDGDAKINGDPPRDLVTVRGYLPSGQEVITTAVVARTDRMLALQSVIKWTATRGWNYEIDDGGCTEQVAS